MATSEAKGIKKQEKLVRFSIISYKTRLRVFLMRVADAFFNQLSLFNETMHHSHQKPPVKGAKYSKFLKLC